MKKIVLILNGLLLFVGCITNISTNENKSNTLIVTFGSCNKHNIENIFWDDIRSLNPDVFIWGGDIVYADTANVKHIQFLYDSQNKVPEYAALKGEVFITGTWDDHDYGLNDGGEEFDVKAQSQQAFLNFMAVPKSDKRRYRQGVYSSQLISKPQGQVKIVNLDTRYFRTSLTKDTVNERRYKPNLFGEGTILGDRQWQWLTEELNNSKADFNIIVSSIQFLSNKHGFEKWANYPSEVEKLKKLISNSKAKRIIILSGDRHISEFSKSSIEGLSYPLIDFTSSGLTHSYTTFSKEENPFRVKEVVSKPSFGFLEFDFKTKNVVMRILGDDGVVLQELKQSY